MDRFEEKRRRDSYNRRLARKLGEHEHRIAAIARGRQVAFSDVSVESVDEAGQVVESNVRVPDLVSETTLDVAALERDIDEAQERLVVAREALAELNDVTLPALDGRLVESEAAVAAAEGRLLDAETELATLAETTLPALDGRLVESEAAVAAAEGRLVDAEAELATVAAEVGSLDGAVSGHATRLQEAENAVIAAEGRLLDAETELDTLAETTLPALDGRLVDAENAVAGAGTRLTAAESALADVNIALGTAEGGISDLIDGLAAVQDDVAGVNEQALEAAGLAASKGRVVYDATEPVPSENDLWIRTSDNKPHVYDSRPHASKSYDAADPSLMNHAPNPAMRSVRGGGDVLVRNISPQPIPVSTDGFTNADGGLSIVPGFAGFDTAIRHTRQFTNSARLAQVVGSDLTAGTVHTVVMRMRSSEALTGMQLRLRWNTGSTADQNIIGTFDVPAGESEIRFTGSSSGNVSTEGAGWALIWATGSVGATLDVTGIQVEQGPNAGVFIAPDYPSPHPHLTVRRTGTATELVGNVVEARRNLNRFPNRSFGSSGWGHMGGVSTVPRPEIGATDIEYPETLTNTENIVSGYTAAHRTHIEVGQSVTVAWDLENLSPHPVVMRHVVINYHDDGTINWALSVNSFDLAAGERRVVAFDTPPTTKAGNLRLDVRYGAASNDLNPLPGTVIRVHDGMTIENPNTFDGTTFSGSATPNPDLIPLWGGEESILAGVRVEDVFTPTASQVLPGYQISDGPDGYPAARFKFITAGAIGVPTSDILPLAGKQYTLLAKVRPSTDLTRINPRIGNTNAPQIELPADVWTDIHITETATWANNATGIRIDALSGHAIGDHLDVACVMFTDYAYTGDYRDGDSPGWVWSGGDGWVPVTDKVATDAASAADAAQSTADDAANAAADAAADAVAMSAAAETAAKAHADAVAEAERLAAIATASDDATSKAAAAQAAAEATAAADALAKANAAQAAAEAKAATAQAAADSAQTAADAAQDAAEAAQTAADTAQTTAELAQTSADGKSTVTYGASKKSSGAAGKEGDTHYVYSGSNLIATQRRTATAWVDASLGHQIIGSVDLGKATVGQLDGQYIKAQTVTGQKILAGSITAADAVFGEAAIQNADIGNLNATKINAGTLAAARIGANSIDATKISSYNLTTANATIGSAVVKDAAIESVNAAKINAGTIAAARIGAKSITGDKIAAGTITATHGVFATGAIQNADIGNLNATKINAGTLNAARIGADTIEGKHIKGGTITATDAVFATGAIQNADIGNLNAVKINAGTLAAARIGAGTIDTTHLNAGAVTSAKITADELTGLDIVGSKFRLLADDGSEAVVLAPGTANFATFGSADKHVSISSDGQIGAEVGAFNEITYAGESLNVILNDRPKGVVYDATFAPGDSSVSSTQYRSVFGAQFELEEERRYLITCETGGNILAYKNGDNLTLNADIRCMHTTGLPGLNDISTGRIYWDQQQATRDMDRVFDFSRVYNVRAGQTVANMHNLLPGLNSLRAKIWRPSGSGTFGVTARGSAGRFTVIDLGPVLDDFLPSITDTRTSGSGGGDSDTGGGQRSYTKTYNATWSQSYLGSGSQRPDGTNYLYQGYTSYYPAGGTQRSQIGFNDSQIRSDLSGAEIQSVEVYVFYEHWWSGSGGNARIGTHSNTNKPSSFTGANTAYYSDSNNWPRGAGRWVKLSSAEGDRFKAGTSRGITLNAVNTGNTYYGYARGVGQSYAPKLRIKYRK